jgi:hypothetical protein
MRGNNQQDYYVYRFDLDFNLHNQFTLVFNHSINEVETFLVNNDYIFIGGNFNFSINGYIVSDFLVYKIGDSVSSGSFVNISGPTSNSFITMVTSFFLENDILYIGGYFSK